MALNYLLSPEFQISVTSGRPDTGGWVETYLAGTRTKYFTSCDFNGTKNPFRVPLDSLGQAVILADTGSLYDVYVYNRYGTLLFSRYNVTPQDGGAISTANITSEDGSITVTQTEHGVDLSVNGHEASVLRATATTLTSDGRFTFTRRQKTGDAVDVGQQGNILAKQGWFHFDVTVKYRWNSVLSNQSVPVTLSTNVGNSVGVFDLSYAHDVTDTLSGEWHSSSDNTEFHVDISGIPQGMTAEVVDFGIHAINGGGSGSGGSGGSTYTGIDGIIVDNDNDEIKPDFAVLQHKLTEGSNIDITNNVISAEVPTQVSELNNDAGYITSADLPVTDVTVDGTSVVVNGVAEITMPTPPTIPVTDVTVDGSSVVHDGVAEITMPTFTQQNADWDSNSGVTEILHKPDLSIYAQSANLATVATTGDYDDLVNKPTIPAAQINSDWNSNSGVSQILNKPSLAAVATTGDYNDLSNKPSIPAAQINADWNANTGVAEILNKPQNLVQDANYVHTDNNFTNADVNKLNGIAAGAEVNIQSNWNETDTTSDSYIQNKPQFAAVAMTGSYADLSNTPVIPSVDQQYSASSTNAQSGTAVAEALSTISVDEVPPVTSSDDGKVLTAEYSGGSGSYSWETPQDGLPASTALDQGKVLTVNIAGAPIWSNPQDPGSVDPGYISVPAFTVRLQFSDTTYDPSAQSYASSLSSITQVSTGVYDLVMPENHSNLFENAFTDPNNIVDILALNSGGTGATATFKGCTSLRYIFNMNIGSARCYQMFYGCTGLLEVHGLRNAPSQAYITAPATIYIAAVGETADQMFMGCTNLKVADIYIRGKDTIQSSAVGSAEDMFHGCTSLEIGPAVFGRHESLRNMFIYCSSLKTFRNYFTEAAIGDDFVSNAVPATNTVYVNGMFQGCSSLESIDGLFPTVWGTTAGPQYTFSECTSLKRVPVFNIASDASFYWTFHECRALEDIPDFNWQNASQMASTFGGCISLTTVEPLLGKLAQSTYLTDVRYMFSGCHNVVTGVQQLYTELSSNASVSAHAGAFSKCGDWTWNNQLSSIPTSWGGTAT